MLYDNGGFYGPDTSWLQAEMNANFDPTNPYLTDAILDTNAYTNAVYDSTNQAWSDYITG
ncbi:MAG: hypothetical protein EDR02_17325 [Actinobacteria bacterium]|nr:MAG: hypothetical protein EDR02_17325 [Actinomycetota bacterium]